METTTGQEMEALFAGLDARDQREVLEYAKALKAGALDEDVDQVHLMGSISRKDLRMVKESLEDEGMIGVVVLRFLGAFSVGDDDDDGDEAVGAAVEDGGPDGADADGAPMEEAECEEGAAAAA